MWTLARQSVKAEESYGTRLKPHKNGLFFLTLFCYPVPCPKYQNLLSLKDQVWPNLMFQTLDFVLTLYPALGSALLFPWCGHSPLGLEFAWNAAQGS